LLPPTLVNKLIKEEQQTNQNSGNGKEKSGIGKGRKNIVDKGHFVCQDSHAVPPFFEN